MGKAPAARGGYRRGYHRPALWPIGGAAPHREKRQEGLCDLELPLRLRQGCGRAL